MAKHLGFLDISYCDYGLLYICGYVCKWVLWYICGYVYTRPLVGTRSRVEEDDIRKDSDKQQGMKLADLFSKWSLDRSFEKAPYKMQWHMAMRKVSSLREKVTGK